MKPNESFLGLSKWAIEAVVQMTEPREEILDGMVCTAQDMKRIKWRIGHTYAIQPGRGQKAVGRTPPIKAIRRERLQEISLLDLRAEMGPSKFMSFSLVRPFRALWNSLYRKPYDWASDPEVWVLEFEKEGAL